ncbi:hypothetical protein [Amorphus sp. 3PC139-8]|uniref:DUF6925 family protein n=1 Tax=Amorphus sp. 3PC139-8 TaxID=2735676 RepID=UPI00345D4264
MTKTANTAAGALLCRLLQDPRAGWSVGTFGAIAEFLRDPDEATAFADDLSVATARGALRIVPAAELRLVAYETPAKDPTSWNHAIALCLPAEQAAMNRRTVVTELGPDTDAVDPVDREAILFDMGLGTHQVDVCVRSADPATTQRLREAVGRSVSDPANPLMAEMPALSPHRVFVTKLGRSEVKQPIPAPDAQSPEGPHTHVLPQLLKTGRTHAANDPIPDGLVPCAHLYPAHPLKDHFGRTWPFDASAHTAFQAILADHGVPELVRTKAEIWEALAEGVDPAELAEPNTRDRRAAVKVAIAQHGHLVA